MLGFVCGDMRHGGENVSAVSCRAFNAVSMIYSTLPCFVVDIEVLQIIIKINAAGAEVSTEKCSVSREHSGDIYMALATKRNS